MVAPVGQVTVAEAVLAVTEEVLVETEEVLVDTKGVLVKVWSLWVQLVLEVVRGVKVEVLVAEIEVVTQIPFCIVIVAAQMQFEFESKEEVAGQVHWPLFIVEPPVHRRELEPESNLELAGQVQYPFCIDIPPLHTQFEFIKGRISRAGALSDLHGTSTGA